MHELLLVRESAEQLTGSGCCGKLEGDNATVGEKPIFGEAQAVKERLGVFYRWVRSDFSPERIHIAVYDPRNTIALWFALIRQAFRSHIPWRARLRLLALAIGSPAVVLDGHVLCSGALPDLEKLQEQVRQRLDSVQGGENES